VHQFHVPCLQLIVAQMAGRRADWNSHITKVFLDLCLAEKDNLNYVAKKGLTKQGWQNLYSNFREKTGSNYDKKQLQNKFNSLKRLYKLWRKLRSASGGGWDSRTGTITMDDEWWDRQIAVRTCSTLVHTHFIESKCWLPVICHLICYRFVPCRRTRLLNFYDGGRCHSRMSWRNYLVRRIPKKATCCALVVLGTEHLVMEEPTTTLQGRMTTTGVRVLDVQSNGVQGNKLLTAHQRKGKRVWSTMLSGYRRA
jgi:hypothetical protein